MTLEYVIILGPMAALVLILILLWKLLPENFWKNALRDTIAIKNGKATGDKYSSSRFSLLVSSIMALVFSACSASFYFYMYICKGAKTSEFNLESLQNLLIAIGIGVIPYAANQVRAMVLGNSQATKEDDQSIGK